MASILDFPRTITEPSEVLKTSEKSLAYQTLRLLVVGSPGLRLLPSKGDAVHGGPGVR